MWVAIFAFLLVLNPASAARCRALAIGGGTDLGAYEAGAVIGLIQGLPSGEAQWDIVTGVGVGSVNALIISMYGKGQEAAAAAKLTAFWSSFSYQTFYQDWSGGYVTGLLLESGIYDSSPMKKTLASLQTGAFQRALGVGTTDLISANYVYFSSYQQASSAMTTGIYASASDYGLFPIVNYNGYQLVSGNVIYSADLIDAINYCSSKGASYSDISIDVVLGAGKTINKIDASNYKSLQVLMRYLQINSYNSVMQAINNAQHYYKGINIRSVVYPSQNLPGALFPYDYTPAQLQQQIALGIQDGKKVALEEIES
jgi:hypothetical protein